MAKNILMDLAFENLHKCMGISDWKESDEVILVSSANKEQIESDESYHSAGKCNYLGKRICIFCEQVKRNNYITLHNEPEKVKVPRFVAEWIEEARKTCKDVVELFEFDFTNDEVRKWFMQERPFDLVARAWLDGYEVEEEKRYLVTLKNRQPLVKSQSGSTLYFSQDITARNYKGTQKELEDANFGWVFDCEGIEIEEVE
ncbi:phage protein [Streptococcus pneumoniae]|nr:phage protein [Streptococcus pneumoniae]VNV96660.1 phage protein [Streptococcus pneumoniae]